MAEFVQQSLESMLPELEQLQRTELFSPEEVKEIVKRRKRYEYSIQKQTKRKEDFLAYIQYELAVLSLIDIRREKVSYMHKKDEIDYSIARRINKLYKILERRFSDDINVWMSHIDFLKRMKWQESIGKIFRRMLQFHLYNESLWISAAKYEWEELKSAENARKTLLEGLRFNKKSEDLYREYFRFELSYVEHLVKRVKVMGVDEIEIDEDRRDDVMDGAIAKTVLETASKDVEKPEFLASLLEISNGFEFTKSKGDESISKSIERLLKDRYPDSPVTWDTLARQELSSKTDAIQMPTLQRLECCSQKYEEGMRELMQSKDASTALRTYYIETLIDLSELVPTELSWWVSAQILKTLKEGARSGTLQGKTSLELWKNLGEASEVVRTDEDFPTILLTENSSQDQAQDGRIDLHQRSALSNDDSTSDSE